VAAAAVVVVVVLVSVVVVVVVAMLGPFWCNLGPCWGQIAAVFVVFFCQAKCSPSGGCMNYTSAVFE
jgi:hypothetical protein